MKVCDLQTFSNQSIFFFLDWKSILSSIFFFFDLVYFWFYWLISAFQFFEFFFTNFQVFPRILRLLIIVVDDYHRLGFCFSGFFVLFGSISIILIILMINSKKKTKPKRKKKISSKCNGTNERHPFIINLNSIHNRNFFFYDYGSFFPRLPFIWLPFFRCIVYWNFQLELEKGKSPLTTTRLVTWTFWRYKDIIGAVITIQNTDSVPFCFFCC